MACQYIHQLQRTRSAKFLMDRRSTSRSVKMSISNKIRTTKQNLNIYNDALRYGGPHPPSDVVVQEKRATHVVTAVTWGADCICSFESSYENQTERDRIKGKLKVTVKYGLWEASGEAQMDMQSESDEFSRQTTVRILVCNLSVKHYVVPAYRYSGLLFKKFECFHRKGGRDELRRL